MNKWDKKSTQVENSEKHKEFFKSAIKNYIDEYFKYLIPLSGKNRKIISVMPCISVHTEQKSILIDDVINNIALSFK
jgi:hypothetical protein